MPGFGRVFRSDGFSRTFSKLLRLTTSEEPNQNFSAAYWSLEVRNPKNDGLEVKSDTRTERYRAVCRLSIGEYAALTAFALVTLGP